MCATRNEPIPRRARGRQNGIARCSFTISSTPCLDVGDSERLTWKEDRLKEKDIGSKQVGGRQRVFFFWGGRREKRGRQVVIKRGERSGSG